MRTSSENAKVPEAPAEAGGRAQERSFATRVAWASLLTTLTALTVAFGLFIGRQWQVEREGMVTRRITLAQVIASNASSALLFNDRDRLREALRSARMIPDARGVVIFDAQGRPVAASGEPLAVRASAEVVAAARFEAGALTVRVPVRADQAPIGELVLVSSLGGLHRTFLGFGLFAAIIFASVLAAAVSAALWLARRVIRPVERVSSAVEGVRRTGNFAVRVERGADRELARLTDGFNGLLGELEVTMRKLVHAREQAEGANRLKSEFLANMSHEMRTPLNGVLGLAQVMAHDELSEAQRERVELIQESASGLMAIISDLLDVAEAEAGRLKLQTAEFDLPGLVQQAVEPYRRAARDKGLSLEVDLAPEVEGAWLGDAARVAQILANLISNAIKFTQSGSVRVLVASAASTGRALSMTVMDTGCGIPAGKIPVLFDKFTQIDGSSSRQFGGAGLGLAICQELAVRMGGRIGVKSLEGVGSVFTAELDLARPAAAVTPAPAPAPAPAALLAAAVAEPPTAGDSAGRTIRVLAAEDNATNALVLKTFLELAGVDLQLVGDGEAAVEAWSSSRFDLILMDIQMPVMDGVSATRRIRALEAERRLTAIPIVACTANVMDHEQREYLAAGVNEIVAKPIEAGALFEAINRVLSPAVAADESSTQAAAAAQA